jgi:ABC-type multidrug transport system permease subunit
MARHGWLSFVEGLIKIWLGIMLISVGLGIIFQLVFGIAIGGILLVALEILSLGTITAVYAAISPFALPVAIAVAGVLLVVFYWCIGLIDNGAKQAFGWNWNYQRKIKNAIDKMIDKVI